MISKLAWLALAGAGGTLARFGLARLVGRFNTTGLPYENLVVNLTGCFLAGGLWILFEHRWPVAGDAKLFALVGFMGAFTTFSAFILESTELMRSDQWLSLVANIMLQNGLGFAALLAGAAVAKRVYPIL